MIKKRIAPYTLLGMFVLSAALTGCKSDSSSSAIDDTTKAESASTYANTIAADTETVFVQQMGELWTLKVKDITVSQSEYYLYLIQHIYNHGYKLENITDAVVSSAVDSTIYQIRLDMLEYLAAKEDKEINISEENLNNSKENAKKFISYFGMDLLNEYYITEEMVYNLFEKQAYISAYNEKIITDISKELYDGFDEKYKDYTFHNMYYALFPTYETDEKGNPKKDKDDKIIMLSESEKEEAKKKAEDFHKRAIAGEKMEDLVAEYGIGAYSDKQINYNGAYNEEMNALVDGLSEGDISDVYEANTGYMIVRMDKKVDDDYRAYWLQYMSFQEAQKSINSRQQKLVKEADLSENDINNNVIMLTDLYTICKRMVAHGLIDEKTGAETTVSK